tara:strand:+ start:26 stop:169 length:144 start_codon:yes stop_codon:yes gene_type:complete
MVPFWADMYIKLSKHTPFREENERRKTKNNEVVDYDHDSVDAVDNGS